MSSMIVTGWDHINSRISEWEEAPWKEIYAFCAEFLSSSKLTCQWASHLDCYGRLLVSPGTWGWPQREGEFSILIGIRRTDFSVPACIINKLNQVLEETELTTENCRTELQRLVEQLISIAS